MIPPSRREFDFMTSTQEASMLDECQIGTIHQVGVDRSNKPIFEWIWGEKIPCGFSPGSGSKTRYQQDTPVFSGSLRLPINTTITDKSRIRLTKLKTRELPEPQVFTVQGPPSFGHTAVLISIQRIGTSNG
jgi:hypothetical protein